MGECGCGEIQYQNIVHALEVGKNVLVVELYTGCDYCHNGLHVSLHLFSREEAASYDIKPSGKFEPENGYSWLEVPIVDKQDLIDALPKLGQPDMKHYDSLPDWLEDNGRDLLQWGAIIGMTRSCDKHVEDS